MAQAHKSIIIDVPADKLYDVINDFEKYGEFLPEVKKIAVAPGPGDAKDVTYTIDIKAKTISYTLRHTGTKPTRAAWVMTKGEMIKGNEGYWALKELPDGKTEATYNIDLKLSAFVPGFVEKALAEQSLPALLENFKKRAEKLHPKTA
jgi:ribosome-associated toxin RatA of RatAB toxin-antitoxin module